jgi:hypothetical protein
MNTTFSGKNTVRTKNTTISHGKETFVMEFYRNIKNVS